MRRKRLIEVSCPFCGATAYEGQECPKCKVALPEGTAGSVTRSFARWRWAPKWRSMQGGAPGLSQA